MKKLRDIAAYRSVMQRSYDEALRAMNCIRAIRNAALISVARIGSADAGLISEQETLCDQAMDRYDAASKAMSQRASG
jgi:hypothetical protein